MATVVRVPTRVGGRALYMRHGVRQPSHLRDCMRHSVRRPSHDALRQSRTLQPACRRFCASLTLCNNFTMNCKTVSRSATIVRLSQAVLLLYHEFRESLRLCAPSPCCLSCFLGSACLACGRFAACVVGSVGGEVGLVLPGCPGWASVLSGAAEAALFSAGALAPLHNLRRGCAAWFAGS